MSQLPSTVITDYVFVAGVVFKTLTLSSHTTEAVTACEQRSPDPSSVRSIAFVLLPQDRTSSVSGPSPTCRLSPHSTQSAHSSTPVSPWTSGDSPQIVNSNLEADRLTYASACG